MVTPIVRAAHAVDALPLWLQWYVRPFGEFTTFTLFPWAAFVFAGGAVGALIAAAREERQERRLQAILGAIGVALVALGFYTAVASVDLRARLVVVLDQFADLVRDPARDPDDRADGALCDRGAIAALKGRATRECRAGHPMWRRLRPAIDPLARLGRNSLFIYWIHVELVYGYASWGWRHRLPLWGTAIGYVLFCVLMYRAIGWRDVARRPVAEPAARRAPAIPQTATA